MLERKGGVPDAGRRESRNQSAPMPTVLKTGPYRFFFSSLDQAEPPHIHVRRENKIAKFWLKPVALERAGGFGPSELNAIAQLVNEHGDEFLERWNGFFGN
jgi:hypothetical protein